MTLEIENFGYCPECQTETVFDECGRCGNDVCVTCHPTIGCDAQETKKGKLMNECDVCEEWVMDSDIWNVDYPNETSQVVCTKCLDGWDFEGEADVWQS